MLSKVTAPFKDRPPIIVVITNVANVVAGIFGAHFGFVAGRNYFEMKNQFNQPSEVNQ
jgi:hypothetical protein